MSSSSGIPSKRLQEEPGNHSIPAPKRPHEDAANYTGSSTKLNQTGSGSGSSIGSEFRSAYDSGQEGRLAKVPRIEHRDADKISLMLLPHRSPSGSNNFDHSMVSLDGQLDSQNSKDLRDAKADSSRDAKIESRELHSDRRADPQSSKGETDAKAESMVVDEKELKSDKGPQVGTRGEVKFEREGHNASNSHSNRKENKDHYRGKRFTDAPSDDVEPWRASRHSFQQMDEVQRDGLRADGRESVETHEAVGENRVDLKDDRFREKDRKKKDDRHRDFVDRDKDRIERRISSPNNDRRDSFREEREMERWDKEKRDADKNKEQIDKEKDQGKMEPVANEKEGLRNDKDLGDHFTKPTPQDNPVLDTTIPKGDSLKTYDKDAKEKKSEMEGYVGDRSEQRGRYNDKETDDNSAEGDGVIERDRDVFGSAVQQRRRMSRSRVTAQATQREPRFRARARAYNEGSQGADASAIIYKAGECMQELLKSWNDFEVPQDGKTDKSSQNHPTLEIRVPAEYVSAANHQVRGWQLWGTDIYTNDSDLVAVLMHTGYCRPTSSSPPSAIQELRATVRVLPPQDCYSSTLRNNVRSRAWGAGISCSYRVESCCIVKKGGGTIDLEPHLNRTSAVEPSLAPLSVERTMTTRSAASNALRQQRFVREVTIQYNLCNEPWLKYSISVVADKGLKKQMYTSARLKKGEILYLETHYNRFELCFTGEMAVCNGSAPTSHQALDSEHDKLQSHNSHVPTSDRNPAERDNIIDVFRWSRCKNPLPQNVMRSIGIPLPLEHLEVLEENLAWEDVQWSQAGVWVAGKEYILARVHFLSPN